MFNVEPMVKVRVACSKKSTPRVIDALYSFGTIQVSRSKVLDLDGPLDSFASISTCLVRLRAIEESLHLKDSGARVDENLALRAALQDYKALPLEVFEEKFAGLRRLSEQQLALVAKLRELSLFKNLDVKPSLLKVEHLDFAFFELSGKMTDFARDISKLDAQAIETVDGKRKFVLVAFDKRQAEKVKEIVDGHSSKQYPIPVVAESFAKEFGNAENELKKVEKELLKAQGEIALLRREWGHKISQLRNNLEWHFKKAELPTKFGASETFNVVEGWIPEKLYGRLNRELGSAVGERISIERVETKDTPPTKLKNARPVMPFEFFIEFFSLPRYGEIDPTFVTALFFPLFFGMIVGDIGYGLVFLLVSLVIMAKFKTGFFRKIGEMMVFGAIATMFFGFVFAEFFGMEAIFGFELHPIISRIESEGVGELMALTVLIGFLHLALGLVIGFFEMLKEGHRKHAGAKLAWLFLEVGIVSLIVQNIHVVFFEFLTPLEALGGLALWITLVGLAGLMYFESVIAVFEIPSLFANMLSYLRIMALGLAGVVLAGIINVMTPSLSWSLEGIVIFVLMAVVFVIGHTVNMVIALFEAGIQSLRLHYVEFYSKFYKGGGLPFVPLKRREKD
ncbi:MAG: V-type ATPase 116kDa subunit family protein [Candidatus Micrarchaeota archaeon]